MKSIIEEIDHNTSILKEIKKELAIILKPGKSRGLWLPPKLNLH